MEPKSNNWYFYKKKKKRGDTEIQRRESYVKTEAEFRVTGLRAEETLGLLATLRSFLGGSRGNQPCRHRDFRLLAS